MDELQKRPLFNPGGDIDVTHRRLIGGNTTNMNDFNELKYAWASDWYRQAMNNFWIPEEINLGQDVKDYRQLRPQSGVPTTRSCRSSFSWTPCKAPICRMSRLISRPMKSTSAFPSSHSRNASIRKAIVTCSIPLPVRMNGVPSFSSGRMMSIC